MQPNFGALRNDSPLTTALQGFEYGRGKRAEMETSSALGALARQPDDPAAYEKLARFAPEKAFRYQERQDQMAAQKAAQERKAQEQQLTGLALNGDPEARKQLAYFNSDLYMKLDEHGRKQVDGTMKTIGNLAFSILQKPEAEQGPALQQALQGLQAQGVDLSAIDTSRPAGDVLRSALAMTGQLDEWEKFSQPRYTAVGEAGLAGFQFGQPINGGANVAPQQPNIPQQAIDALTSNPALKEQFDAKYGQGASDRVAGGQASAPGGFRAVRGTYRHPNRHNIRAADGSNVIASLFGKGVVTSGFRGPNHPLSRKNPNSWHARSRGAVDMRPVKGMTFEQAAKRIEDQGYTILEARDEVKYPSSHATGPHWHFVIGEG